MKRTDVPTRKVHITPAGKGRSPYFYVPFDVSEGTTRLDVTMRYARADDCIIDFGCADPRLGDFPSEEGFRGWSGGAREAFFIAADDATPGYVHGEMPAGRWRVILGLYKVPARGVDVELTFSFDNAPRPLVPQPQPSRPVRQGAGWYKGDLHCHTFHSDAKGSPELLHAAARQARLDFLAVSDHNTITQRRYFHVHSSPDLVFVRAMEVTTEHGHANVFGVDEWVDFRMSRPEDAHALSRIVREKGGLLSVNHDKPPIPWNHALPEIDCMEVWQQAWLSRNWVSLARYQERLAAGLRIAAIGGSDFHQPDRLMPEGPFVLARPTTVLWLDELSEEAVLAAMKAGRGYVTESPSGPHLALTVDGASMGATVRGGRAEAHVKGAAGDLLAWFDARGEIARVPIDEDDQTLALEAEFRGFVRCEVLADASHAGLMEEFRAALGEGPLPWQLSEAEVAAEPLRRAVSNPVYVVGRG
ncbi:CehA/McbA family metallohydrolase [Chelativorans salis]|uniref:CehA/McbA family metallohydrolase n=1 Tax=Chelativorans salis TaxID=2978478 RepID=A0ABT2LV51_9HYPH|nr:CehA/McbA family metallohydrolase [Chelativorans sp. EGI FJ00035]MCT7378405.1 CehA/McbA family metallohydrolase [Chelativorans sp. EGI FJ00035]